MEKYPSLNGLRAISILLVVCSHLSQQTNIFIEISNYKFLFPFLLFIREGQLGVNVFFVISGFLITSLLLFEESNKGKINLRNFFMRRVIRIFPAYYTLLCVYFLLELVGVLKIDVFAWFSAITYTKYFNLERNGILIDWFTAHGWSLSVEEHFYLFWPFVFIRGNNFRKKIATLIIIIVPLIRVLLFVHPITWISNESLFTRIDAIAIGCFVAFYKQEIIKRITPFFSPLFYTSLILLLVIHIIKSAADKKGLGFLFIPFGTTSGTIANISISIVLLYSLTQVNTRWYKFLNLRVLNYLGILSYSIYLWQQLFIYRTNYWINQFPQNIFLILLVSLLSYNLIEAPFLKLKKKFASN